MRRSIVCVTFLLFWGQPTAVAIDRDTKPPVITSFASPWLLWPPNGGLVQVTVSGRIKDESGINTGSAAFFVLDEYQTMQPRGPIVVGPRGTYSFTILLQALRDDQDLDGREYSIIVTARDNDGNMGWAVTSVVVPHDRIGGLFSAEASGEALPLGDAICDEPEESPL